MQAVAYTEIYFGADQIFSSLYPLPFPALSPFPTLPHHPTQPSYSPSTLFPCPPLFPPICPSLLRYPFPCLGGPGI